MDFDVPSLIVTLIFSVIGLAYVRYGKKEAEVRIVICGCALMAYGYFVNSLAWNIGIGVVLSLLPLVWR